MYVLLYLGFLFITVFALKKPLSYAKINWLVGAILAGAIFSTTPVKDVFLSHETFKILSELGMYFLLFIIGFEINYSVIRKQAKQVFLLTTSIILFETLIGSFLLHYFFNTSWLVSILVATSFSTVGEALLVPILDEFKKLRTKLGQLIIGVGVLDDSFELLTILLTSVLVGKAYGSSSQDIYLTILLLIGLSFLTFTLVTSNKYFKTGSFKDRPTLLLFVIAVILIYVGLAESVKAGAIGALLSGIALQGMLKNSRSQVDEEIKIVAYGFLAPIFFFSVGLSVDFRLLQYYWPQVILVILAAAIAKILPAYIIMRKSIGLKKSLVIGVGLLVKLSSSLVILSLLLKYELITNSLYSVLVTVSILFAVFIPAIFNFLIQDKESLKHENAS